MIMGAWGLGRKPKLPYDAEVEYLESTGTQWIDTGVQGVAGLSMRIVFSPIYPVHTGSQAYWGGNASFNNDGYNASNSGSNEYKIGFSVGASATYGTSVQSINDIEITSTGLSLNGTKILTPGSKYTDKTIYLFGFNYNGVASRLSKMRLYSFRIDGVVDLQPVRFTNELGQSEGAMYDRLGVGGMNPDGSPRTDGLYRNCGTRAFLWGEKQ